MKVALKTMAVTGGNYSRTVSELNCAAYSAHFDNLDAPQYSPCGSHNSYDVTDWRGNPLPAVAVVLR